LKKSKRKAVKGSKKPAVFMVRSLPNNCQVIC
jgi:hypothetical protein